MFVWLATFGKMISIFRPLVATPFVRSVCRTLNPVAIAGCSYPKRKQADYAAIAKEVSSLCARFYALSA
jgi:hypothetical protein